MLHALNHESHRCKLLRFRDGDTCEVLVDLGWGVWLEVAVRLVGIDSWELSSADRARAQDAAHRLTALLEGKLMRLTPTTKSLDRYGRIRARMAYSGLDLADSLVKNGFAWYVDARATENNAPQCPQTGDLKEAS
jgi:endonuclease YncB( thermonuclease family)